MKETLRLVQLQHASLGRQVALVQEPFLLFLSSTNSVYELAMDAIRLQKNIHAVLEKRLSLTKLKYDNVYAGHDDWKLLPSFDHPTNPFACLVSGTGLTHKNSALNRHVMHQGEMANLTDSMKIYQWGLEGGQPDTGTIGVQPEWFYKGTGNILHSHGTTLEVPAYSDDGGEEPEVAGIYLIDETGQPYRIGFTSGNEFSDHTMEQKNYLYLAPSKLRNCSIGPELILDTDFQEVSGKVSILRESKAMWSHMIMTGEKNMAHSLANLEYHHFKYPAHRLPGQAHVHFLGADAFSFGQGIRLQNGDVMSIYWEGFGRAFRTFCRLTRRKKNGLKWRQSAN